MKSRRWPIRNNKGKEVGYGIGNRIFDGRGLEVGKVFYTANKVWLHFLSQPERKIRLYGCQLDSDTDSLDDLF